MEHYVLRVIWGCERVDKNIDSGRTASWLVRGTINTELGSATAALMYIQLYKVLIFRLHTSTLFQEFHQVDQIPVNGSVGEALSNTVGSVGGGGEYWEGGNLLWYL